MSFVRRANLYRIAAALFALVFLPAAKNGCGSKEANTTFTSPVQAVTTLLEHDDGSVEADLVLISTATSSHHFIDDATNVYVRIPDGTQVPLALGSPGHYAATGSNAALLTYQPGSTYQFKFELNNSSEAKKVSGGNFSAVTDAPDDQVSFSFSRKPAFAGDTSTITWSPSERYALIRVIDASGSVIYENFDFAEPHFDGSKWARLKKGGTVDLGVDVFADPGTYTVRLCAVNRVSDFDKSLSADLGALSGFLIGRCAAEQTLDVPQ